MSVLRNVNEEKDLYEKEAYAKAEQARKASQAEAMPDAYCNQAQIGGGAAGMAYSEDYALRELFTYHSPNPFQQKAYENIREAAKNFVKVLLINTPNCSDRSAAIRKVREAVMTANAAIALNGFSL